MNIGDWTNDQNEEIIYKWLFSNCTETEPIEYNKLFTFQGGHYVADFYLSNGCRKLRLPPKTAIEIKRKLLFDTVDQLKARIKRVSRIGLLLIIYVNKARGVSFAEISGPIKIMSINKLNISVTDNEPIIDTLPDLNEYERRHNSLITQMKENFEHEKISLILGAGVSQDAGALSWKALLSAILDKEEQRPLCSADFEQVSEVCDDSALIIGRFLLEPWRENGKINTTIVENIIRDCLYKNINKDAKLINQIAQFIKCHKDNINGIITYNYDDLVESAMKRIGLQCNPAYGGSNPEPDSIPVYHVHGILPQDKKRNSVFPVLSEESYHALYKDSFDWSTVETLHALMRTTCILIGLSMTDPNLRRLLEFATSYGDGNARHYVFLRKQCITPSSTISNPSSKDIEFWKRQERIMNKLGLNIVWVHEYSEIPQILHQLC